MDLQQVLNSPLAVRVVSFLAQATPPRIGYPLCNVIGSWIAKQRNSQLTRAVRNNQSMARGINVDSEILDQAVEQTLQNNARDIYTLYHYLQEPDAIQNMIHISPQACEVIQRPEFAERGLVILGIHSSNFDFVLRSVFQRGFKAMVLTIPDPQGGRRVEYEMRKQIGMNLIPTSVGALRDAVRHLERGGMVVTGLDHPIPHPGIRPRFFGKPASLPVHYVYLASKARVPIVVMAVIQQPDGVYHLLRSDFLEMKQDADEEGITLRNAERVLIQAETFIRQAPGQWNVPLSVWSE